MSVARPPAPRRRAPACDRQARIRRRHPGTAGNALHLAFGLSARGARPDRFDLDLDPVRAAPGVVAALCRPMI